METSRPVQRRGAVACDPPLPPTGLPAPLQPKQGMPTAPRRLRPTRELPIGRRVPPDSPLLAARAPASSSPLFPAASPPLPYSPAPLGRSGSPTRAPAASFALLQDRSRPAPGAEQQQQRRASERASERKAARRTGSAQKAGSASRGHRCRRRRPDCSGEPRRTVRHAGGGGGAAWRGGGGGARRARDRPAWASREGSGAASGPRAEDRLVYGWNARGTHGARNREGRLGGIHTCFAEWDDLLV